MLVSLRARNPSTRSIALSVGETNILPLMRPLPTGWEALPIVEDGGFEMGSGIYINVAFPEETAEFLRKE